MPIDYWINACLIRVWWKSYARFWGECGGEILQSYPTSRSWMNCTIGCTIFFIYFFAFIFYLCFLVDFLGHEFLFSILFLWIFNNCFDYEKLFWFWKIALSSLFDYFSNALSYFLYIGNYKWDIIQLNMILIVVLKKSRCFPFFLDNEIKILYILDWRNEIYGWVYSRCGC